MAGCPIEARHRSRDCRGCNAARNRVWRADKAQQLKTLAELILDGDNVLNNAEALAKLVFGIE